MKTITKIFSFFLLLVVSNESIGSSLQKLNIGNENGASANISSSSTGSSGKFLIDTSSNATAETSAANINSKYLSAIARLKQQGAMLEKYAREKHYDAEYCFLVDMSIPSGKKRFFVYNLKKDSIEFSSLVTHGFGSYKWDCKDQLTFSNMSSSLKTSLGKYKIGKSYNGHYGLAYKLYGLDSTNSNAFSRDIVLHSHIHVPDNEVYPEHIMESLGCPTVSPVFLAILDKYVKDAKKPILLWIYD